MADEPIIRPLLAAQELTKLLSARLDENTATITLTRDETLIALALIEGVKDVMIKDAEKKYGIPLRPSRH